MHSFKSIQKELGLLCKYTDLSGLWSLGEIEVKNTFLFNTPCSSIINILFY